MKIYKTKVHNLTKETAHLNELIKKREKTEKLLLHIVIMLFVGSIAVGVMQDGKTAEAIRWEDKQHPTPYSAKTLTWISETEKRRIK